jgi:hypothetical protein
MNHQAIYNTHPSVAYINADVAYDASNQVVAIDQALYDAEVARLSQVEADKEAARLSAIQKLATAAGLTTDEQTAIFGG